jgi:hypothetical protein
LQAPLLAPEVVRTTGEVVEFRNGSSLEISTNDVRLIRGRSAIAVLGSECCHWKTDEYAASSDEEVVAAADPSMAMCPDAGLLLLGSSVYRKRGFMYRRYGELHGKDDTNDVCWFAPSVVMNPKLPQHAIDAALASNAARARAEFNNVWREDLSDFIPLDVLDACTERGVYERPPHDRVKYFAFADAAGGTGSDSFAFAVAHKEASYVLDAVREHTPRFVPAQVIADLAQLCRNYRITEVSGDKYAVGFHAAEWKAHGIKFVPSERSTSENYLAALPLLLAKRVRLIDNATLRNQLASLERRVGASDRESIDHPPHASAHDDVSCAAIGALMASTGLFDPNPYYLWALADQAPPGSPVSEDPWEAERKRRWAQEDAHLARYRQPPPPIPTLRPRW